MGEIGHGSRTAAEGATGENHAGSTSQLYTWSIVRRKVLIQNNAVAGGVNLYVRINAATASLTDYDVKLRPGAHLIPFSGGELLCARVAIWADGALNYNHQTGFVVRGWA